MRSWKGRGQKHCDLWRYCWHRPESSRYGVILGAEKITFKGEKLDCVSLLWKKLVLENAWCKRVLLLPHAAQVCHRKFHMGGFCTNLDTSSTYATQCTNHTACRGMQGRSGKNAQRLFAAAVLTLFIHKGPLLRSMKLGKSSHPSARLLNMTAAGFLPTQQIAHSHLPCISTCCSSSSSLQADLVVVGRTGCLSCCCSPWLLVAGNAYGSPAGAATRSTSASAAASPMRMTDSSTSGAAAMRAVSSCRQRSKTSGLRVFWQICMRWLRKGGEVRRSSISLETCIKTAHGTAAQESCKAHESIPLGK